MSAPQIPPRPIRSYQQPPASSSMSMDMPKVPPRPIHRSIERSRSPNRESFPMSPLNEPPMTVGNKSSTLYGSETQNESVSSVHLPKRPSIASLPSIGQEGSEYAELEPDKTEEPILDQVKGKSQPEQTRNVGSDLPLHAPRPSFTSSTNKARVSAVTRTDSSSAMAAGIGKTTTPTAPDDKEPHKRILHPKVSFSRPDSSASTERPGSGQEGGEHGIPDVGIGQRVPMYPDAGDVQAPSPSPFSQTFPAGIGFHNDGSKKPHGRNFSGREVFHGPPGSYGLHGHGIVNADQFEKSWYEKHPEILEREEQGQYGPAVPNNRPEWALSSEDLNKIVRETASRGAGYGTSHTVVGLPDEQIGYMATEEYASRINTPHSATFHHKAHSNHSQLHVASPLRKASFPVGNEDKDAFDQSKGPQLRRASTENALESETEDDVVHIDAPAVRRSKIGGSGYDPPTENLGPEGGNTENQGGWIEESGYGVPILASDEVAKELGTEYLQPAVSPPQERRGSIFYSGVDSEAPLSYQSGFRRSSRPGSVTNSRPTSRPTSRPSSRPGSIHGSLPALSRFTSHEEREDMYTPLADVEEYEPLFPQDEDKESHRNPAIERLKKKEMKRRFPSQDIWEDTPNSLQLQATVTSPEPTEEAIAQAPKAPTGGFEPPEAESARKGEVTEDEKAKLVPREDRLAKSHFKPHVQEEIHRPGLNKRFPSRDIWEDSPDSARLETTVDGPLDEDFKSPADEGLQAGAVVKTSGRPKEADIFGNLEREGATAGASTVEKPSIPPRPTRNKATGNIAAGAGTQAPIQIPPRPPKRLHQVPPAETPLPPTKSTEASPTEGRKGPVLPDRPKPQVPARPNKPVSKDSSESVPLSKTLSTSSAGSAAAAEESRDITSSPSAPKPKPTVPARPVGGKIAALKAGFMSDLNKQLQLGPQGPKLQEKPAEEKDVEEEKALLADARKGRARGPARRKPGASSTGTSEATEEKIDISKWGIQDAWTVWQSNGGGINVVSSEPTAVEPPLNDPLERPEAPTPIKALTAHNEEIADVPGIQALKEAVPSSETSTFANKVEAEPEASGIKEAAVSDLLQHDTQASETTIKELSELTSKAPAVTAPAETSSAASKPGEKVIMEDLGLETAEKLTAYLGLEEQAPETTSDVGNVTVQE